MIEATDSNSQMRLRANHVIHIHIIDCILFKSDAYYWNIKEIFLLGNMYRNFYDACKLNS